jgi:hypothetical protein
LVEAFKIAIESSNKNIRMIPTKMDNGVSAKVDIIVELKKMNLTYEKLVEVGIKLMDNPKYIHLFWVFEEEQKTLFVIRPIQ